MTTDGLLPQVVSVRRRAIVRIVTRWIFRGGSRAGKNYSAEQWAAWVGEQRKSELLLFELGELEELLEEAATADNVQANDVASSKSAT